MFWLAEVELLYMGCVWVLLICSFWVCKNVGLAIVSNALISESLAGGIGAIWTAGSLQRASLQFYKYFISVNFVSLVCVWHDDVACRLP